MVPMTLDSRGVLVSCPSCGKTNRVSYALLDRTPRCASCHAPLPHWGSPINVPDEATFDAPIAGASVPVLVDFWAPWCGPCHMMAPELEKVARRSGRDLLIAKVDTQALQELGTRFRIMSIPLLVLFRQGKEVARLPGARPADAIQSFVAGHLTSA